MASASQVSILSEKVRGEGRGPPIEMFQNFDAVSSRSQLSETEALNQYDVSKRQETCDKVTEWDILPTRHA